MQVFSLKDISSKIGSGATPRGGKNSYVSDGISLIRSLNVYDFEFDRQDLAFITDSQAEELSNVEVNENDILLNITGASVARCTMVPSNVLPARVNQHVAIVRIRPEKAEPKFVFYTINSPQYKKKLLSISRGGATREALTKEIIENFEIQLPELKIQRRIASILSAYDDLIENNTRRIKILEDMARLIYREWFVEFRAPGVRLRKATPEEKKVTGKDIFPEGWEVLQTGKVFDIKYGNLLPSTHLENDGKHPVYGANGVIGRSNKCNVDQPTVLVSCRGAFSGKINLAEECCFVTNNSLIIRPIYENDHFNFSFVQRLLEHANINSVVGGAAQPQVTIEGLSQLPLTIPRKELIINFTKIASPIALQSIKLKTINSNLRRTRDLLLPRLINGEITFTSKWE